MPSLFEQVEQEVARASGVTVEDMRGRGKQKERADARAAVWTIAYRFMGYSYPYIASIYDRDHTTIIAGVKRISNSPSMQKIVELIAKNLPQLIRERSGKTIENWRV